MKVTHITEISVVLGILGAALLAGAQVVPEGSQVLCQWLTFSGTILVALGGSGVGYRISKKVGKPI